MLDVKRANGGLSPGEIKAHEAATLRLYGAGAAPKKFARLEAQQVDGVLRGQYRFAGAGQTGRMTSRGAQIQNLTRDVLGDDGAAESPLVEAIAKGCDYAALVAADPVDMPATRKLALIVRPAIVAGSGKLFVWSDWSAIEARITPWLAASEGAERSSTASAPTTAIHRCPIATPSPRPTCSTRTPTAARSLYAYQQRAATWFYESDAAFLVAPLGAGKGAAALTALAELIRDGERRHALVIAPKLVAATVWPQEVTLWPHLAHLRVAVLNGTPERRREVLAAAPARAVTAIGIDLVPWLTEELAGLADDHPLFDVLIVDETSRLKDPSGKRARALLKVAGRFRTRWGLTRGSRLWIWRRHRRAKGYGAQLSHPPRGC
jgi:hypothetical protein